MRQVSTYYIREQLASGHLGAIHRAEHVRTHESLAVKIVPLANLSSGQHKELETEIRYLMAMKSEKVVKLKEYLRTGENMYLFMEMCEGGSLMGYVMRNGPASEPLAKRWLHDIASALQDMRRANAMHRDVKLSHILLTSTDHSTSHAKLSGTGFSRFALETTATRSALGTPLFMAPEILRREEYGYKVDVWSLGVTAYWLLLGIEPYQVTTIDQLQTAQRTPISFNKYCTLSADAQSFILSLMQYVPNNRPSYEQILAHSFLCNAETIHQVPQPAAEEIKMKEGEKPPVVKEKSVFSMDSLKKESSKIEVPTAKTAQLPPTPVVEKASIPAVPETSEQGNKQESIIGNPAQTSGTHVETTELVISRVEGQTDMQGVSTAFDPTGFSLIEISPFQDDYSIIDFSQVPNLLLEGEDCKKLLPLITRFRSVYNLPMARSLCLACDRVYQQETTKGKALLRGFSMQESYLGPLLQAINARLERIQKEMQELGPQPLASCSDFEAEIRNRLTAARASDTEMKEIYEEVRLLSKTAAYLFPEKTQNFEESYEISLRFTR